MKKKCFVVMSFQEKYDEVYELGIKRAITDMGYDCFRLDEDPGPKHIPERLVKELIKCDLVIVDVTEANPNVYYELGISHTIGNKTVLLTQNIKELPFDIKGEYVVNYTPGRDGFKLLQVNLKNTIQRLEENAGEPTNMVQIAGREYFDMRQRLEYSITMLNKERERLEEFREYLSKGRKFVDNKHIVKRVSDEITSKLKQNNGPSFVSVCGAAGIGKSYFTKDLCKEIYKKNDDSYASYLPLDSFMKDRTQRVFHNISGYDIRANDIDKTREAIEKLRNGESIEYTPYNHVTGSHDAPVQLEPSNIIFLDGIHSLHPLIVPEVDYGIFISANPEDAKELRFIADVLDRCYVIHDAFAHADHEYKEFEKHVLPYIRLADTVIQTESYWNYKIVKI